VFNLGAGEVLVILLLALIVLGPQRLPDAARQVGRFTSEIRKLSSGFQAEMKAALEEETEAQARARGAAAAKPAVPAEPVAEASDPVASEPVESVPLASASDEPVAQDDEGAPADDAVDDTTATDERPPGDDAGDRA
jgi:sec-independent protein translocase protein TatB